MILLAPCLAIASPNLRKGRLEKRFHWGGFSPAPPRGLNRSAPFDWQGSTLSAAATGIQPGTKGSRSRFHSWTGGAHRQAHGDAGRYGRPCLTRQAAAWFVLAPSCGRGKKRPPENNFATLARDNLGLRSRRRSVIFEARRSRQKLACWPGERFSVTLLSARDLDRGCALTRTPTDRFANA